MKKVIFIIISCLMLSACCMIEFTYPGRDKMKWKFSSGRYIYTSPAIGSDGTVYVGSWDYDLYAIQTNCGGPADSPWPMFRHDAQHTGRK